MSLYTDLAAEVKELLTELGQSVTYNRYTQAQDLVAGTSVATLSLTQVLKSAVIPAAAIHIKLLDAQFMAAVEDGTEKRLAVVETVGATFVPGPKDFAVFGGRTWQVVGSTAVNLDGVTDVVYVVGLVLP